MNDIPRSFHLLLGNSIFIRFVKNNNDKTSKKIMSILCDF